MPLAQVAAARRELQAALDALDALDHLCEVQQHVRRIEEGIGAALYILDASKPAPPIDDERPPDADGGRADV